MVKIAYSPTFVKQFNKSDPALKLEVKEKIEALTNRANHHQLRVHKLHGQLKNCYGFSVNYKWRIIFTWIDKGEVYLLTLGDHDVYKN